MNSCEGSLCILGGLGSYEVRVRIWTPKYGSVTIDQSICCNLKNMLFSFVISTNPSNKHIFKKSTLFFVSSFSPKFRTVKTSSFLRKICGTPEHLPPSWPSFSWFGKELIPFIFIQIHHSGQIIIFHQPFPEIFGDFPLLFTTIWGENSCFRSL